MNESCRDAGLASLFGLGSKKTEREVSAAELADSFKGFSFTKEDDLNTLSTAKDT